MRILRMRNCGSPTPEKWLGNNTEVGNKTRLIVNMMEYDAQLPGAGEGDLSLLLGEHVDPGPVHHALQLRDAEPPTKK